MSFSESCDCEPISIAALERDTGLSKDSLRVWERRYGFPRPLRDQNGERVYPFDQVQRLRLVKRLMDQGHRPGKLLGLEAAQLQLLAELAVPRREPGGRAAPDELDAVLARIKAHDAEGLRRELSRLLLRAGLARFTTEVVAPLATRVGEAWGCGELEIFEEHLFTEAIQSVLRNAISALPPPGPRPRVLLTTFPQELHGLGLLMAEAMLALEGAHCLSLGVTTPLWNIVLAARARQADIVALSFSSILSPALVIDGLDELRTSLPRETELWAGGSNAALRRRTLRGVRPLRTLEQIAPALARWRQERSG